MAKKFRGQNKTGNTQNSELYCCPLHGLNQISTSPYTKKKTHLHRDDHYNGHINIKKVHKDVVEKFERIEKVSPECGGARKAESRKPENQMTQVRVPSPILYMHHVGDICNRSINIEQNRPTSRCRRRLRRLDKNDI